jgi:hypothetical protein
MLARILTGKATVQQAGSWATTKISSTLTRP